MSTPSKKPPGFYGMPLVCDMVLIHTQSRPVSSKKKQDNGIRGCSFSEGRFAGQIGHLPIK
jgi:hypothetical protein